MNWFFYIKVQDLQDVFNIYSIDFFTYSVNYKFIWYNS